MKQCKLKEKVVKEDEGRQLFQILMFYFRECLYEPTVEWKRSQCDVLIIIFLSLAKIQLLNLCSLKLLRFKLKRFRNVLRVLLCRMLFMCCFNNSLTSLRCGTRAHAHKCTYSIYPARYVSKSSVDFCSLTFLCENERWTLKRKCVFVCASFL